MKKTKKHKKHSNKKYSKKHFNKKHSKKHFKKTLKNNINNDNLTNYSKNFNQKFYNNIFKNINTKNKFDNILIKSDYIQNKKQTFKNLIDTKLDVTNQKYSGRCWLFAFLNIIRIPMIKKYNIEQFEFSQNYLFFYDKLEKANFFINYIFDIDNFDIDNNEKLRNIYLRTTNDGGTWNLFNGLINKYGVIPKTNMDDHYHSGNSDELNTFFNNYLKKLVIDIKNMNRKTLNKNKNKFIQDALSNCYKILTIFLGEPPKKVTWEYYTETKKEKKINKSIENITPIDFYKKYVPYDINDKICLINYPCKDRQYFKPYVIDVAYTIIGSEINPSINVPIKDMVDSMKKSINNKEAVWLGIDSDKYISEKHGFYDEDGFNYKDIFNFDMDIEKCDSLNYFFSGPNHAVIAKGYNLDGGKTNGFLIENSWGKKSGFDGNYFMSLDWFNKYNFIAVVDKKFVTNKVTNALKLKPIVLPYYSPFGAVLTS